MRKTRLVILPTKCLHQMGFLLLFLSCPVIGDWGRIRPESENSHKAIQIDREGSCGLQRDPPGKLVDFLDENGSDQCQLSEDYGSNEISKKPIFGEVRRYGGERRVDLHRVTRERNVRESERREGDAERKDVGKATQRMSDERRVTWKEPQRGIRRDIRETSQIRARNTELRQSSRGRQQENERATRKQIQVSAGRISKNDQINSRNEKERLHQIRRMSETQNERRIEQQRRSLRENERTIPTARQMREGQTQRLARSTEGERQHIRRDSNRSSVRDRSLRKGDDDVTARHVRGRSQLRQTERLSLTRKEQDNSRRSENGRNAHDQQRSLSQIRKTPITNIDAEVIDQRMTRSFNNRRSTEKGKVSEGNVRERRVGLLSDRMDRIMEIKSTTVRVSGVTEHQSLPDDVGLQNKSADEKLSGGITKWMDLKRYQGLKGEDWTKGCVIGAVVYFFSTRQIKAV